MADTQFHGLETAAAPNDWVIPGSLELILKAARAVFDGTAAVGAFLPALEIISDSGSPVGTYVATSAVAAGDAADVSFAPFLRPAATSSGGSGIQYDVDNTGDWLLVETTSWRPATFPRAGIDLHSESFGGIILRTDQDAINIITGGATFPGGALNLLSNGNGLTIIIDSPSASPLIIDTVQGQLIDIGGSESQSGNINIGNDPATVGNFVGFFNAGGATQQTLPAAPTGAQIRAVLVAFGLVAP